MTRVRTCLGLGSNLSPRRERLKSARDILAHTEDLSIVATSSLYESEPWGVEDQPPFLNAALLVETGLSPGELLSLLKETERALGRRPSTRWGPREIDLDILYFGDLILHSSILTLPHPRLLLRSFALLPAAEVDPNWLHPESGLSLASLASTSTFSTGAEILSDTW